MNSYIASRTLISGDSEKGWHVMNLHLAWHLRLLPTIRTLDLTVSVSHTSSISFAEGAPFLPSLVTIRMAPSRVLHTADQQQEDRAGERPSATRGNRELMHPTQDVFAAVRLSGSTIRFPVYLHSLHCILVLVTTGPSYTYTAPPPARTLSRAPPAQAARPTIR